MMMFSWGQNPFYDLDMPIRCELFDRNIDKLVRGE